MTLSLCVVLLIWPFSVLSSSFWLSFGALAAVLYIALSLIFLLTKAPLLTKLFKLFKIS
ncbi:ComEC/Rec2 family competence protein [Vibrio lentus]|nr:ComEC/Rec2 family competence protein [Vibrio lentus]